MTATQKRSLILLSLLSLGTLAAEFVIERPSYLAWESWFGFYPWLGFVSCALFVLIAKKIFAPLVRTDREPPR